jgi:two-component system OmpR family sensor kinase
VLTYGETAPSPPRLPARIPVDDLVTVEARDGSLEYRVDAAPSPGGGLTIVAIPLSGVDEQLDELLLVEGLVIGGALLLMAALGWWVVRLGLRPLERIGDTAGKIAAGDLSQRVEPAEPTTEVGRLGLSLNAMLHQIERAFAERAESEERLRVFLADASHELRTPLASIRGYAELFRMGAARDEAEAEKAMSRIEQEAARMGVLVEDLLLLARLDEVREAVREPVDLAEIARDAVADARATAPDRDIALSVEGDETVVPGDEDRLRQVLANLVRNALVHTPPGAPVEVAVAHAGNRVRLEVRDRGPGLPVADGELIFERFWRADPARGRGAAGAGLGLAIVQGIVAAHGGEVRAETRRDGGATFIVALPALSADSELQHTES